MQIRWRKNPKTEDGWPKRIALAVLAGLGVFLVSLPIAFLLFLNHLQHSYPDDTQNFLGAITSAVLIGVVLAGLGFAIVLGVLYLLSFRDRPATR